MPREFRAELEGNSDFDNFKGKVSGDLGLHILQMHFGRTSEQVELLANNIARVVFESANLLGLDPNSISLESMMPDASRLTQLHGKKAEPIGGASEEGVVIPITSLLNWSRGGFLSNLELASTLAHETHHVANNRRFQNYHERLKDKKRTLISSIRDESIAPSEKKQLQSEFRTVDTSSYSEIAAQLFAREYIENYYLPSVETKKDRRLSAFLSMVDFSLDFFNKRMSRTYLSLIGKPLTV
ncbi:hypothetical protein COU89_01260 [Candidatus Roizmanbacteria bacterium CG10_big_fil_rev_8_21_14_0_10_45_7]|uniref:Uncharacterized protein n=1 Tax=Candidatus Roizmanbacteria bacterium CG10_big_fil_rev_8_21_14_0_10_45_7 TaxID=1974854 RepID=A0A2M8KV43_9BACT|nr:MAG: hypothetical protein COU89_01260 [Candidatus Roizmanbacteria bacterium CG10_big_fil_rev_8_21_14_0_10_45_7]